MINPLILANSKDDPTRVLRSGLVIAVETSALLARIGIGSSHAAHAHDPGTMIANWLSGLLLFVFWVGFFIAIAEKYVDVVERSADLGILRILGASDAYILRFLFQETLISAIPGAFFGLVCMYLSSASLELVSGGMLKVPIPYLWWPVTGALSTTGSLIGDIFAFQRAIREGVAQAL